MFPNILIVDDEPSILRSLGGLLTDEGFEVSTAGNGYEALKIIETDLPDLVLLDIWMPGIDGIETLKEIKKHTPSLPVVMITGHGTIDTAVNATKFGAYDFIEKPLSIDKVIVSINNALNFRKLEEENKYLKKKTLEKNSINGNSPPIITLRQQIAAAAPTDTPVLITGENGTGKELVLRTIHQLSQRSEQPLISVNCAAIPEDMIESELFGREKGGLMGNDAKIRGKFEVATHGTLFLDEIGDLSLKNQGKLLRALQDQKFKRVGGSRELTVDIRIISATNKDLVQEIEKGNFREDLYYRLNVIPVEVPPLRNRKEDIPVLIETFLNESALRYRYAPKRIEPKALDFLTDYDWPGNVRELKNLVERLIIMTESDLILAGDIPAPYNSEISREKSGEAYLFSVSGLSEAKALFAAEFIKHKLAVYGNDVSKTAQAIGVDESEIRKHISGEQPS